MTDRRRIEYTVGVNDQQFNQGATGIVGRLKQMAGGFGDTSTTLGKLTQGFGVFAGLMGARQLVGYAGDAIQLAVAAEEVNSKFQAVFGSAQELEKGLREWGDMAGVTETQAKGMAATFGNLAMAQGISEEATQKLTMDVAKLAGDMASFNDQDPAMVFDDLNKALLTTEREGMKKYGIAITETEVKTLAAARAAAEGRTEVTQADRAYASYAIVVRQAGKAVGDLERTQDSAANVQRQLQAEMRELQEEIGQQLLPVFNDLLQSFSDAAPLLKGVATGVGATIAPITGMSAAARAATDDSGSFWDQLSRLNDAALKIVSPIGAVSQASDKAAESFVKAGTQASKWAGTSREIVQQALRDNINLTVSYTQAMYNLASAQTAYRKAVDENFVPAMRTQAQWSDILDEKYRRMMGWPSPWSNWGPPPDYYGDSQYNPPGGGGGGNTPLAAGQAQADAGSQWNTVNGGPV